MRVLAQSCLTLCDPHGLQPSRLLFMGFSRREYWCGRAFLSPGDFLDPRIEPWIGAFFTTESPGKPLYLFIYFRQHWVFVAAHRLSLVAANGGSSLAAVCGLLIAETSVVAEHRL